MKANKCFPEDTKLNDELDLHFQLYSVGITCDSGANTAATLANGGMCPTTDERVLKSKSFCDTASLMFSCGLYDYSGQFAFKNFVKNFNFHNFDVACGTKCDPRNTNTNSQSTEVHSLLYAAYNGDVSAMKRFALQGVEMTQQDYDRRTALHVAAAEGKIHVVRFLIEKCDVDCGIPDRWGKTPLDDAKHFEKEDVVQLLETHMGKITVVTNAKSD
ncbi:Glutaminase liver isoform, mitochondrial [Mizuhopecten yessoensis]|uniref:glutaminase n=1 Tax=Mizuhopecten yessoensis TaxID=6573 RepID=A0A210PQQ7_MIZYE|nr:Glutaminase liver isoform, mitochondrial [Mizuhopecten yessoensis]